MKKAVKIFISFLSLVSLMGFKEESKLDYIINGHSHTYYTNDKGVPSVQSGSSLAYIANTTIKYNKKTKEVVEIVPYQEKITSELKESKTIKNILNTRLENFEPLMSKDTRFLLQRIINEILSTSVTSDSSYPR